MWLEQRKRSLVTWRPTLQFHPIIFIDSGDYYEIASGLVKLFLTVFQATFRLWDLSSCRQVDSFLCMASLSSVARDIFVPYASYTFHEPDNPSFETCLFPSVKLILRLPWVLIFWANNSVETRCKTYLGAEKVTRSGAVPSWKVGGNSQAVTRNVGVAHRMI